MTRQNLSYGPLYRDEVLPARMLRYRSDIWEATLWIRQVVIFFYKDDDNGLWNKWTGQYWNTPTRCFGCGMCTGDVSRKRN